MEDSALGVEPYAPKQAQQGASTRLVTSRQRNEGSLRVPEIAPNMPEVAGTSLLTSRHAFDARAARSSEAIFQKRGSGCQPDGRPASQPHETPGQQIAVCAMPSHRGNNCRLKILKGRGPTGNRGPVLAYSGQVRSVLWDVHRKQSKTRVPVGVMPCQS